MFDSDPAALDPAVILDAAHDITRSLNLLEAGRLEIVCCWADANAVVAGERALPGCERAVRLGGDGTPLVAEFAPAELGTALGESAHSARALIGDALDLRHRHPVLWRRVLDGEVKAWVARRIVQAARHHSLDLALQVDALVAPYADRKTAGQLERIVEAHLIRLDPAAAEQAAEASEAEQGVWLSPSTDHGTREILIRTTAASAAFFDARIDRIADDLAICGDQSPKDARRAAAVGMIGSATLDLSTDPETRVTALSQSKAVLYVHLTDHAFRSNQGVARVEGDGPVTVDQVRSWLGHTRVTVKPVIDLNQQAPVDAYEVPDRLREAVHLITPTDCFPFATNQTRRKDIDHTVPFDPGPFDDTGPPGQTAIGNLGPMTRHHHRIKPSPTGKSDSRSPASTSGAHPTAAPTSSTTPEPAPSLPQVARPRARYRGGRSAPRVWIT